MASGNQSPSYLQAREHFLKWIAESRAGQFSRDILMGFGPGRRISEVLEEDHWTDFDALYEERKGDLILAADNKRVRDAFERGEVKPSPGARFLRFFSPPMDYVLRRQADTQDPNYWNSPTNTLREALAHPLWCTVPADYIRGVLEQYLPKPKGALYGTDGLLLKEPEPIDAPEIPPDPPAVIDDQPAVLLPPSQGPPPVDAGPLIIPVC